MQWKVSTRRSVLRGAALLLLGACLPGARGTVRPRDATLAAAPLFLYPAVGGAPRALVVFYGNDNGFWRAHQQLAERMARDTLAVVGVDVRALFGRLPDAPPARRDSAFVAAVAPLVARARRELRAGDAPLILGGHSLGAEAALWTAAHAHLPALVGVLALGPGSRSHLRVTLADRTNRGEPHEAGSFGVAEQVRDVPRGVRVAVVRGEWDHYRFADSALVAAGARPFLVPGAHHSLNRITASYPVVRAALASLLAPH